MKVYDETSLKRQLTFDEKLINRLIKVFTAYPTKAIKSLLSNDTFDNSKTYDLLISSMDSDVNDTLVTKYKNDIRFKEISNYNPTYFKFYVHLLSLLDSLNIGGTLILKVPINSPLVNKHIELLEFEEFSEYLELNEYLVSNNLLKAYIKLPRRNSNNNKSEKILVFKKNNISEDIYFVDLFNKRLNNFNSLLSSNYEDKLIEDIINNYLNSNNKSNYTALVSRFYINNFNNSLNINNYINNKRVINNRKKSSTLNFDTNITLKDANILNQKINDLIYKIYEIDNEERLALDILFKESRD